MLPTIEEMDHVSNLHMDFSKQIAKAGADQIFYV